MAGYLIRGATVHDGTGAPGRRADVAIDGERIAAVGPGLPRGDGRETIDGDGLVLAPGFIDLHSHADFTLPAFPEARNSLTQGVTSEVIGNCGFSPAPVELERRPRGQAARADRRHRARAGLQLAVVRRLPRPYLDAKRPAVNVMALVGHSALRIAAMGMDDRPATPAELAEMRRLLRESIDQGAWGFSTGLVYPPGSYGGTDEVIEIGRALTETNALYASHIRNESDDVHVALKEALDIGRTLGVRTEISHLKAAGRQNHGRLPELVGMLDEARASGLDVHSDGYPYDAGSTMLNQLIPPWAHDGGVEALVERLRSPEQRARMRHDIEHGLPGWQNLVRAAGTWDRIIVASVTRPDLAWAQGKTVAELASAAGAEPLEWTMDFLVEDFGAPVMIIRFMDPRDVDVAMTTPTEGMGSDQLAVTTDDARVHPRCYGTFVRFLAQYVRERNLVPMEQAIHRMTGMAAAVVGVRDRGRIAEGLAADLVLFDPSTVADRSTYDEPTSSRRASNGSSSTAGRGVARGELVARDLGAGRSGGRPRPDPRRAGASGRRPARRSR